MPLLSSLFSRHFIIYSNVIITIFTVLGALSECPAVQGFTSFALTSPQTSEICSIVIPISQMKKPKVNHLHHFFFQTILNSLPASFS